MEPVRWGSTLTIPDMLDAVNAWVGGLLGFNSDNP